MTLINKLKKIVGGVLAAGAMQQAAANDIVIGTRGPTEWQLDVRGGYGEKVDDKGNTTRTTSQNDVLKYWNTMTKRENSEFGAWAFANVPAYKSVETESAKGIVKKAQGFGDFMVGAGPRGSFKLGDGSMHLLTYGGATIPTGDMEAGKPSLTGDAVDPLAGVMGTYFFDKGKKIEADWMGQYNFAGTSSIGTKRPDYFSAGLIAGGQIFDSKSLEIRLAGGMNGQFKENLVSGNKDGWNYSFGPRAVVRFTPKFKDGKKHGHFELIGDYDTNVKGMPKGFGVMGQLRVNF